MFKTIYACIVCFKRVQEQDIWEYGVQVNDEAYIIDANGKIVENVWDVKACPSLGCFEYIIRNHRVKGEDSDLKDRIAIFCDTNNLPEDLYINISFEELMMGYVASKHYAPIDISTFVQRRIDIHKEDNKDADDSHRVTCSED